MPANYCCWRSEAEEKAVKGGGARGVGWGDRTRPPEKVNSLAGLGLGNTNPMMDLGRVTRSVVDAFRPAGSLQC